jgi:ferredoxin
MHDVIISKNQIAAFVRGMMEQAEVIAPVAQGSQSTFRPVSAPDEILWSFGGTVNSTVSPTAFLFPQAETMFSYQKRGSDMQLDYRIDEQQRIIVGIRPCDVHSLRMLDRVLIGGEYQDPYYASRRKHTALVALACNEPGHSCFCTSFGAGPSLDAENSASADLLLTDLGDRYYVNVFTPQWQAIIDHSIDHSIDHDASLFTPATAADVEARNAAATAAADKVSRTLDTDGLSEALAQMFDSPYWDDISKKCLSCGACTYLCPLCYCFDVFDQCNKTQGERVRCWDACTFRSFALLAGGHNPRPTIAEGYRQKMYHKFNYAVERYGEPLCVGCGRCLDSCPVNMDIVRILSEAKEVVGVSS